MNFVQMTFQVLQICCFEITVYTVISPLAVILLVVLYEPGLRVGFVQTLLAHELVGAVLLLLV